MFCEAKPLPEESAANVKGSGVATGSETGYVIHWNDSIRDFVIIGDDQNVYGAVGIAVDPDKHSGGPAR